MYYSIAGQTRPLSGVFSKRRVGRSGDCSRGSQYGAEVRLTNAPFNMERAPVARGYFVGDYEGLANDVAREGTDFTPFFSRPQGEDPATIFFRRVGP